MNHRPTIVCLTSALSDSAILKDTNILNTIQHLLYYNNRITRCRAVVYEGIKREANRFGTYDKKKDYLMFYLIHI